MHNISRSTVSLVEAVRQTEAARHEKSLIAAVDVYCTAETSTPQDDAAFAALFRPLFERSSPQVRRQIAQRLKERTKLPSTVQEMLDSLNSISQADMANLTASALSFLDATGAQRGLLLQHILTMPKNGPVDIGVAAEDRIRIEHYATTRQHPEFIKAFGDALGLSATATRRIASDEGGEPLLIGLIATGLTHDTIVRVLLLNHDRAGRSVEVLHGLVKLARQIDADSARLIVLAWRRAGIATPVQYQAVTSPSLAPSLSAMPAPLARVSAGPGLVLKRVEGA